MQHKDRPENKLFFANDPTLPLRKLNFALVDESGQSILNDVILSLPGHEGIALELVTCLLVNGERDAHLAFGLQEQMLVVEDINPKEILMLFITVEC